MRSSKLFILITALVGVTVLGFAEEGAAGRGGVGKNDPNQGHGLRLEAEVLDKLPTDLGEAAWEERTLDFGPDLKRIYQVVVKYAVSTKPDAATDIDRGWVETTQKAAVLKGMSFAPEVARALGIAPGFYVGLYRARMNDATIKEAKRLGEIARVLEIRFEELQVGRNGMFENSKVFEDPNPVLVRACASVSPLRGREILFFIESIHPDSKEGRAMDKKENEDEDGATAKEKRRAYRGRLTVRKDVKKRPDGTYGAPGEEPTAADNAK